MGRAGSEAAMLDSETASASALAPPSPPLPPPPPWSVVDFGSRFRPVRCGPGHVPNCMYTVQQRLQCCRGCEDVMQYAVLSRT